MPSRGIHTLRIRCVDPRYSTPKVCEFLHERIGPAFIVGSAGGSLFVHDEGEDEVRAFIAFQVRTLIRAGISFDVVHLMDHYDATACGLGCRAYGEDDSHARHTRNARSAILFLMSLPGLEDCKFRIYLHDVDGYRLEELPLPELELVPDDCVLAFEQEATA